MKPTCLNILGRSHGDQTLSVKTTSSPAKPVFGFMFRTHLKLQEFNRKSSSRLTAGESGSERDAVNTAALCFLLIVASRVDSRCSFINSPGRSVCTQPPPLQSEIKIRCRWLVRGFLIRWVLNDRMLFKLRLNCFRPVDGKLNMYSQVVPGGEKVSTHHRMQTRLESKFSTLYINIHSGLSPPFACKFFTEASDQHFPGNRLFSGNHIKGKAKTFFADLGKQKIFSQCRSG